MTNKREEKREPMLSDINLDCSHDCTWAWSYFMFILRQFAHRVRTISRSGQRKQARQVIPETRY